MESFGVTGNGRLWAGGWRILLERPLALQQVSGEEREGPYGPAFASHQPFVQLQMWGGRARNEM